MIGYKTPNGDFFEMCVFNGAKFVPIEIVPEVKKMKWVSKSGFPCCPICGHFALLTKQKYCHNCGQAMEIDK